MIQGNTVIANDMGLHGRPANRFVKEAKQFSSAVTVRKGSKEFDGKSIVKVLTANIRCGDAIEIVCDGADEKNALDALVEFIESGAGEE